MRRVKYFIITLMLALMASLFSSCVETTVTMPPNQGYFYLVDAGTQVAAGGWPIPYARDGRVSSPSRHADIVGVWVTSDEFIRRGFVLNYMFWAFAIAMPIIWLYRRRRRMLEKPPT